MENDYMNTEGKISVWYIYKYKYYLSLIVGL